MTRHPDCPSALIIPNALYICFLLQAYAGDFTCELLKVPLRH